MREFLEKNWSNDMDEGAAKKLCMKALLEVVDSGAKNMEIAIVRFGQPNEMMTEEMMQAVAAELEAEAEEAKEATAGDVQMT
ncbi:unnamed protein product [Hapterophycus canaliculatus]